jgi:hypothetical protein
VRELAAPTRDLPPWGVFAWFTDMPTPNRDALGLTSTILDCDRTAYRFRAELGGDLMRWTSVRRGYPGWAYELENAYGARPMHWYVSRDPVPVIEAPRAEH